ncbi:hypothetical protein GKE56_04545 [Nostocoides sp. HKS02]|nr:hypothetical protein GKE56_04545 [Tetrasphaera sp. HKS02]
MLDHDLIQQLESAGVPLEQLLVPCPAGAGGSTGGTSGGSGVAAAAQQAGDVAAALTGSPLNGRLAFTGATVVPLAVLAGVLLWAGSLLVRFSRSLTVQPRGTRMIFRRNQLR